MAAKQFLRDTKNGKVYGLCAGFAEYASLDVSIVRVVVLAIILFTGIAPGLLFYLIAAAVVPAKATKNKKK